jgi:DNA modification methylase
VNHLYYGDNLSIMQKMPKNAVDLIYLDPPFNSQQNYNLLYKTLTGKPVPEQAEAFCDTWEMDAQKEALARAMPVLMREYGVEDYYVQFWHLWMQALRHTQPHLLAYLIYMVERLLHMKVILKPTGSIYLHCDPTASHYIKVMMDGIFGHKNFKNEIIWKRTSAHNSAKRYGPVHDVILFYGASENMKWVGGWEEYDKAYIKQRFARGNGRQWKDADITGAGIRHGETGKEWRGFDVTAKGRHWAYPPVELDRMDSEGLIYWPKKQGGWPRMKRYLDEAKGIPLQDVWTNIAPINSQGGERLGYPTQKPVTLLERIIKASTDEGDVVFDPFCGCGTTIYAAEKSNRKWIGCDIAILSIKLIREVLAERYRLTEGVQFQVNGIPVSVEQAEELFKKDPFQFEHWMVERVGGFPTKKTGDKGIDGRMYFETRGALKSMVLSVKGGKLRPTDVRDLRGVLADDQDAEMAGFLSLQEPSKAMREAAAMAGQYVYGGVKYDRIQFLTAAEILEGKRDFHTPTKMGSKISTGQASLAFT